MRDELDPDLAAAFAQTGASLADDDFLAGLLRKIERARRARLRRQLLVLAAAAIAVSLNMDLVLEWTVAVARAVGELTPVSLSSDLLTTPWGWVASLGIGAGLLFHLRPSRRR
ncbi:MAG TPA: hypothetical protein VNV61_01655 [Steroidobacteraceae bacterium]|nr:hypothetical protein [Steroidobacteraceae bacterium]